MPRARLTWCARVACMETSSLPAAVLEPVHAPLRLAEPLPPAPAVDVVIPVYNEQRDLRASVRKLHCFMQQQLALPFRITIADNASSDETLAIARALAAELQQVEVLHLELKGRGRALRAAWSHSDADVVAYMDVDLSTQLSALPALLAPLFEQRADIVIGSRLVPGAEVERGIKREFISRSYNLLLHLALGMTVADAQCGFKAARREAILPLLPQVEDDGWFFDTELLHLARRAKLVIREIPVRWVDDPDSKVAIFATAREDVRGIKRLRRHAEQSRRASESNSTAQRRVRAALITPIPPRPSRKSA